MMEAETTKNKKKRKNDLEALGGGGLVFFELQAVEIGVGVLLQDELHDIVTRGSEGDMVGHATGHSGVQESDQLALRVEDS